MIGESGVTRSITDDRLTSEIQRDQNECESGVIQTIIEELPLQISKEIKWKVKMMLFEVTLMNFILGLSKEMKRKVKVLLLEVLLMILILWISNENKLKVKVMLLEV